MPPQPALVALNRFLESDQRLDFEILLEPELAHLAAVARALVTAHRRRGVAREAVEEYASGANATADGAAVVEAAREHVSAQSVLRAVGDVDRLVFGRVVDHGEDRSEDLFLRDRHVGLHTGEE